MEAEFRGGGTVGAEADDVHIGGVECSRIDPRFDGAGGKTIIGGIGLSNDMIGHSVKVERIITCLDRGGYPGGCSNDRTIQTRSGRAVAHGSTRAFVEIIIGYQTRGAWGYPEHACFDLGGCAGDVPYAELVDGAVYEFGKRGELIADGEIAAGGRDGITRLCFHEHIVDVQARRSAAVDCRMTDHIQCKTHWSCPGPVRRTHGVTSGCSAG